MELRKSSDLGGIDEDTHHVFSYERRALLDEEVEMKEMAESESKGIKDEDLEMTRGQLLNLNRLLTDIKERQKEERHRLSVHAAINEHSHSRMVLSSLMETVLFMMVTGFQIYTIRRWFSGAPILGR